jgi:ubiquinone/menaquinone biosynthesis C-methylase UbiE
MMNEAVETWYDARAEYEWMRLFQDGYHRLEFLITMHFLEKYLPEHGVVLDAGGGPGRYAIELAKKGYKVILLDLSPKCLEIARNRIEEAGVKHRVIETVEGSIIDLSRFKDASFDAVLCLGGPLSHILKKTGREQAASELVRVTKERAPLFISVFNRYGFYRVLLHSGENLADASHERMFATGVHRAYYEHPKGFRRTGGFTDAYFFFPDEIRELFEEKGVQTIALASCQGLSSDLIEDTNALYKDKKQWRRWLKVILQTCTDPCLIGLGTSFLYIGRKTD